MRTLVVSDLHLGMRRRRDVLSRCGPRETLLDALAGFDRLVLLGDVIELVGRARERAMTSAEPVLRALGRRLGREREVVIVPGNHDRALVRPWLRQIGGALAIDSSVPLDATPELAAASAWLAPARVTARYPGAWLSNRLWATHGHYLNRHLLPTSSVGITRGPLGRLPRDSARPVDYERPGGGSLPALPPGLTKVVPGAAVLPQLAGRLVRPELSPLNASLLGLQMHRASLPALAHVVQRLGVDADWVLFGHVHRLGPLADDNGALWTGPGGKPRIANTGSWLYEPLLVRHASPPHPYWPGGAVILEDGRQPQPVGLLDHLAAGEMR